MPRILEMKEIDGKLAVFLDMPPDEASPVHLWTDAENEAAIRAEREACAKIAEAPCIVTHEMAEHGLTVNQIIAAWIRERSNS